MSGSEQDHIDRFLAKHGKELPGVDLEVEGIVDRIAGISRRLRKMMDETLAEFGLTWAEFTTLGALRYAGPPFRLSPGQLADKDELSTGAMTNRLDKLERGGFVRRLPDPTDRRALQVELTEEGRRVWEEAAAAGGAREAVIASALDERDKEKLNSLLRQLMLAFESRERGRT